MTATNFVAAPEASSSRTPEPPRRVYRLAAFALIACCIGLMFGPFTSESIGGFAIALMIALILLKVPVGVALCVSGVLGLYAISGPRSVRTVLGSLPYDEVSQWTLSVLPMFVLMGMLLSRSGITETLYTAGRHWLGMLPGGLAIGTNVAGAGLAAISGSTVGTTYALARIGIPEMLRAGYDRRLAVGAVLVAGLPGQLIPPSIFLVLYAGIAQVPVGPQLVAGIGPGLLTAACSSAVILLLAMLRPGVGGRSADTARPAASWGLRWRLAVATWPVPVLIALVLGGMFTGTFTATEAGAAGALGALLLTLWSRRKDRPVSAVVDAAAQTVSVVGAIFLLIIGAFVLSRLLAVSGIGPGLAAWLSGLGLGRAEFLLVLVVVYLALGMFMDPLSIMLLTVPLLLPTLEVMGISPLWFGVFVVLLAELAILTPPLGILSFVVHGILRDPAVNQGIDVSIGDVFRAVGWFLPTILLVCLLLIAFPEVATFLPNRM